MTIAAALEIAKAETVRFGRALRVYEAALEVFGKAASDAERAELRPMIDELHRRAVAADARLKVAIAHLEDIEFRVN